MPNNSESDNPWQVCSCDAVVLEQCIGGSNELDIVIQPDFVQFCDLIGILFFSSIHRNGIAQVLCLAMDNFPDGIRRA